MEMTEKVPRICVIGAGSAGLASIKSCLEEGLDVVCYEKTSNISGLWYYRTEVPEGVGRVQKTTITNTSKEINGFSDFPFPKDFPNYMNHKNMSQYFESYAKKFDLLPHIMFEHSVLNVEKDDDYDTDHRLRVTVQNNRDNSTFTQVFEGVMVCTGHHTLPRFPHFPGQESFKGKIIHSRDMPDISQMYEYEDKNAVVVGMGNSGCDTAVELSNICEKTYMALRSGGWIFHRLGPNGIPIDLQFHTRFIHFFRNFFPFAWICWYYETFFLNERFNHRLYGIEPDFRCFSEIPSFSDLLPTRILCGKVVTKKNIDRFTEDGVVFVGEEKETKCDLVVMATGYHYTFPLIHKSLLEQTEDKALELYKQVFPKELPHYSLGVIGAVQPNGGIFSVFEMQARWYAKLMAGKCQFPTHEQIVADIEETAKNRRKYFYDSPRNHLGVDWISYMDDIAETIGVKPDLQKYLLSDTMLYRKLVFGTCLSYQYRLRGEHSWSGARDAIMQSDYRVRYALNPNEAKSGNCFSANFYRLLFSLILFLFAFIAIEIFD